MKEGFKKYQYKELEDSAILQNSITYRNNLENRRSIRFFSDKPVDKQVIENIIMSASSAPSGANKQPWTFLIVNDFKTKCLIRQNSEIEENIFYTKSTTKKWVKDLKPLHTNSNKNFLTEASYLIPIFYKNYELDDNSINYYAKDSTCIAVGFLTAALHLAGLSTLTYTPTNRSFLSSLLKRPKNEQTLMILAVGLPSSSAMIPRISKKKLNQISEIYINVNERNSNYKETIRREK